MSSQELISGPVVEPIEAVDEDFELDDEFIPEPPHRYGKVTLALSAALLIAAGFLGGALVQKHNGTSNTTSAAGNFAAARRAFGGEGFPAGGPVGGGFAPGGTNAAPNGTSGTSGAGAAQAPAVIGTVSAIKGSTVTVTNFGGRAVRVAVTATTTVTTQGLNNPLKVGDQVVVYGTSTASGAVTATAITVR